MTLRTTTRADGGMELTITLTTAETDAIGPAEAEALADWFDTALWGLAMLRTGLIARGPEDQQSADCAEMDTVIRDLDAKLLPRLDGIRNAAIKQHKELGGSVTALASSMNVARSTAQARREALEQPGPRRASSTAWQEWATGTTQ